MRALKYHRKVIQCRFRFCPDIMNIIFLISLPILTFTIFLYLSPHKTLSTLLILAVHKMHVIYEPSIWPGLPQASRSSVIRASDQCAEG